MAESYYEILGVDPDASGEEISDAYRDRVLETHPDRNDDPDAAAQFKRVQTARSVLSDDAERARYDRLGHDSYVRFADRFSTVDDATSNGEGSSVAASTGTETASSRRTSGSSAGTSTSTSTSTNTSASDERDRNRSRGRSSHHARQRRRRQRATAGADRTAWFDGTASTDATGGGSEFHGAGDSTARTGTDREAAADREFRYAVHDWDDPIDLEWDSRSIDHHTAVAVGCLTLLYPLFVYVSLTSLFPLVVNVVVGACTVFLVGYLLTMPKLAMGTFGLWSVLVPLGAWRFATIDPFSAVGAVIVGAFWVPLGYAMGIWWALRP